MQRLSNLPVPFPIEWMNRFVPSASRVLQDFSDPIVSDIHGGFATPNSLAIGLVSNVLDAPSHAHFGIRISVRAVCLKIDAVGILNALRRLF
jgi:hypothetical protein